MSFEGGLALDDEEEGRNSDQQSSVQVPSLSGAFEFAPPTSLHQPYQGTAHCISCWTLGAHGKDLEMQRRGDALGSHVHLGRRGKTPLSRQPLGVGA